MNEQALSPTICGKQYMLTNGICNGMLTCRKQMSGGDFIYLELCENKLSISIQFHKGFSIDLDLPPELSVSDLDISELIHSKIQLAIQKQMDEYALFLDAHRRAKTFCIGN